MNQAETDPCPQLDKLRDQVDGCALTFRWLWTANLLAAVAGIALHRYELADLEKTLSVVHGLPRQAPIGDLWPEFAPKFAEIRAEMGISLLERIRLYFVRLFDSLAEGWAIFISTVRMTYARSERLT